ncbi:MAG: carboxypeptidase-like regulatory domain-containing protein, partial [Lentimicrobium sp.]|nr:carboxypeptidase-like regulatory domain-containing protein [Lentimicrobium sp.]
MNLKTYITKFALLTLLLLGIVAPQAYAQNKITAKGTVVNTDAEALVGVTLLIEGTTEGTATDINGKFTLEVTEGAPVRVSFIGYKTQTVNAKSLMNI